VLRRFLLMVSASSWSLIEGSEIFFTITECPLTAVATALVLIWLSANSFEIALETVPESTIIESTTMSEASGSSPGARLRSARPSFQLHRLDARGAHIQANNGLRSESKHVPTFFLNSFPVARTYRADAAFAAFGFFLALLMFIVLFCSIH
jgi:hypothetical protein